jgi:hypothetical protein
MTRKASSKAHAFGVSAQLPSLMTKEPQLAGTRWESLGCRRSGAKRVVTVIRRVAAKRIEIEDADTHRRRVIKAASLLTAYARVADDEDAPVAGDAAIPGRFT